MNDSETAFKDWAHDWQEHNKIGWPDFLSVDKGGRLVCVEVKRYADDVLSPEQERVMNLLSGHIPCYRWDTELGLQPYSAQMPSTELRQLRDKRHNEGDSEPVSPHRRKLVVAVMEEHRRFRRGLTASSA